MPSHLEQQFIDLWLDLHPSLDLHSEYRFLPPRRFRFDFAAVEVKVAIEINGGNWGRGRHTNPKALINEYEKLSLAALHGWRVFLLSGEMVTEEWVNAIAEAIKKPL